jgi:nucleoid-associated protein YgaU
VKLEKAYLALISPAKMKGKALDLTGFGSPTAASSTSVGSVGSKTAAALKAAAGSGVINFKFNPKEYSVQKSAKWESKPTKKAEDTAVPEFKGAEPSSLTLELFLDESDSESGSVIKDVELLFGCCTPTTISNGAGKPSPPFVLFGWGQTMGFAAFVKSVNAKYTLFRSDGTPIRATCSVTLQEVPTNPPKKQNPTSGSIAAVRMHTVLPGDSLPLIAYGEFDDVAAWRAIADANKIDDPLRIRPGTELVIPAVAEAAPAG